MDKRYIRLLNEFNCFDREVLIQAFDKPKNVDVVLQILNASTYVFKSPSLSLEDTKDDYFKVHLGYYFFNRWKEIGTYRLFY